MRPGCAGREGGKKRKQIKENKATKPHNTSCCCGCYRLRVAVALLLLRCCCCRKKGREGKKEERDCVDVSA